MTWCSTVSVICTTLQGCHRLITWVNRYNEFSVLYPEPPKTLQKGFVEAILLHAYYCSGSAPQKRESLYARLAGAIDGMTDPRIRLHMMSIYVQVAIISGIKASDHLIIERFERHLKDLKDDPLLYLGALTVCSSSAWTFNHFDKLLNLEWQALEVAKESGISAFDYHIHTKIVIAALGLNKFDLARQYLNIMKENIAEKSQIYQSIYFFCTIAAGTYLNEPNDLDKTVRHYWDILESTHFPPLILHTKLLYANYLCVQKKTDAALALHDDLLSQVKKLAFPGQFSRFYMIYAKIFFDHGEWDRCDIYLSKSFVIAKHNAFITYAYWQPELMVWACQRALSLGIETAYINHFVEMHYPNLPQPEPQYQQWPWPFRVYTFGGFELKTRNETSHQIQRADKLFTLLRTLVKAQNRNLSSYAIKEKLYGEGDYEKASQLLDTQIHRLRKHLGYDQAILRTGDHIKLHLKYFWIDTHEFEALGKERVTTENALAVAKRLQELYRGEYLPDDEEVEIIAHRERYRNMYLATLFKCIDHMETETDKAIEYCQNALVLEPLSEPLYRKLISIYLRQDNRDMAEVTLEQWRKLVKRHLDSDVSNETLSLLKSNPRQYI